MMSASKDRLTAERALPPVPSPSVVDTRIPQARRPSLSSAYSPAPAPPGTDDSKTGKITIEPNLKPPLKLPGPIRVATPLSQLSRSVPQARDLARPKPGTPSAQALPYAAAGPIAKPIPRTSSVAAPAARASTSGTLSSRTTLSTTRDAATKTLVSHSPSTSTMTAPRQPTSSTTANTSVSNNKPKPAVPQQRPSINMVRTVRPSVSLPPAKSQPQRKTQNVVRSTAAPAAVKRENVCAEQNAVRLVPQATKPAVQGQSIKRLAPVQVSSRSSSVLPTTQRNHQAVTAQPSVRPFVAQESNRAVTKPSKPGPNASGVTVKVESTLLARAPAQTSASSPVTSRVISRPVSKPVPAVKPSNAAVAQVNRTTVKVENRVAVTGTPTTPNPVGRNLVQAPAASISPAAQAVSRRTIQGSRPALSQVNNKLATLVKTQAVNPAPKPTVAAKTSSTTPVPPAVHRVAQSANPIKAQRVMKVVHPTPVVKTLTRPMARVIPTQALANIRSTPRATFSVALVNQARAQAPSNSTSGKITQVPRTPVKSEAPKSAQTTAASPVSASKPPIPSKPMSQLTEAQQKMLPSVPNMTAEILAAAVAAAAAVEPTPPLVSPGQHISTVKSVSQTPKKSASPTPSHQAVPSRPATSRVVPQPAPRPAPRPVTPAPVVTVNVTPTPVPVPMFQPATIPEGMTFRDGEHVTIWNRLELRKIAGNAAPLGKNLARYLREHPDCEVFTNQDEPVRANRRKRQKLNIEEAAAGEHIPIWNRVEKRKIAGNASPLAKNLKKYLETRPDCEVYTNQDIELKNRQQEERANRARSESLAQEAAAQNRELYPDPFSDSAPPLDDWIGMDPEAIMQALNHSSSRETASLLLGMCEGADEDDINVAIMEGPGESEDLDISEFLEGPETVSADDVALPGIPDDFLASPMLAKSPSVEIS